MAIKGGATTSFFKNARGVSVYPPMACAVWIYMPNTAPSPFNPEYFFLPSGNNAGGGLNAQLQLHYVGQNGTPTSWSFGCNIFSNTGGTFDYSPPAMGLAPLTWHHLFMSITGSAGSVTNGRMYVNGVYQAPSTGVTATTGYLLLDNQAFVQIGTGDKGAGAIVAYPAVWRIIPSDPQIALLAKGYDPRVVAPQGLGFFSLLSGATAAEASSQPELYTGSPLIISGTPFTLAPNPPLRFAQAGRGRGGY
jgi:hypothetical protein